MRVLVVVVAGFLALGVPALAGPMEEPDEWTLWTEDEQYLPLLAGDVKTIRVGTTATDLHIEFTTYDTPAPAILASSEIDFVAQQARSTAVRFVWDMEPRLWIAQEEVTEGWAVSDGSGPGGWHLQIRWTDLGVFLGGAFALRDMEAAGTSAAVTDSATGPDLEFTPDAAGNLQVSVASLEPGVTVEGPDYGGGASVTVDDRGEPLVSYYIYDGDRGTEQGIYLARISDSLPGTDALGETTTGFAAERIAGTKVSRENGRDAQMRTQVAHDGNDAFVLFTDDPAVDNDEDGPGHPGTPDSVYVLAHSADGWAREDPTPGGASDVGPEDVSDLVARDGRVVAAVPVGRDVWVVERTGSGLWRDVVHLPGANNAKLALDSSGGVHAAYVVYASEDGSWREGTLYYASSKDGFKATHIGDNIDSGWEEPETDGSFAIAVGPQDEVALLWNDGRSSERDEEQRVAILEDGQWTHDFAPLSPSHGNPQYTMRLGYTGAGHLVAASGYGGTDSLAVRGPNGGWVETELPRYDVWDMAVSPSGQAYFAYTQPHGGTTVALSVYGVSPQFAATSAAGELGDDGIPGAAADARRGVPSLGVALVVALVGFVAAVRRKNL